MGLLDVLNGMQNGPRGGVSSGGRGSGMSPITMAILGLLAYKGIKHFQAGPASSPSPAAPQGGLGDILGNLLGGPTGSGSASGGLGDLLKGGGFGGILSGGLGSLIHDFQQSGQGETANSWVGHGQNKDIAPADLEHSLGPDVIRTLIEKTGMSKEELLSALSRELPQTVDELTPEGRLPTEQEALRWQRPQV